MEMETFMDSMLKAVESDEIGYCLKLLFKSIVEETKVPTTRQLTQSVRDMEAVVSTLKGQLKARDDKIASLRRRWHALTELYKGIRHPRRRCWKY